MKNVAVNCHFEATGRVRISYVLDDGRRLPVEQGRQWRDDAGLHVLVMLAGAGAHRLSLRRDSLLWQLQPAGAGHDQTRVI